MILGSRAFKVSFFFFRLHHLTRQFLNVMAIRTRGNCIALEIGFIFCIFGFMHIPPISVGNDRKVFTILSAGLEAGTIHLLLLGIEK